MSDLILNVSRTIKAPAKTIYNAWLDPKMLAKFIMPMEEMHIPKAETDPRVGGRFTIVMATKDQQMPHSGEYKVLNPYSQIVFSWESPFSAPGSTVTLNLKEVNDGTEIELIHVKFPDEETRSNHENGWSAILACLEQTLGIAIQ